MVVAVALHFTVVAFWATQSVVERPVSAASCTPRIAVLNSVIVAVDIVASAVSVLYDTVVGIDLNDLNCSGYHLALIRRWSNTIIWDRNRASFLWRLPRKLLW